MQNARMIELEKLAAKSTASPMARAVAGKSMDFMTSDEFKSLKEENKVVRTSTSCCLFASDLLAPPLMTFACLPAYRGDGSHAAGCRNVRN